MARSIFEIIYEAAQKKSTELDLSYGLFSLSDHQQINTLPPEIGRLESLTHLYLSRNDLTALPPEIGNLQNLRSLYVNENKLTTLPPEIGNLKNLETLCICNNKLTTLPVEIGNLKNLVTLFASENQLTILPMTIKKLNKLVRVNFYDNQITAFPPGMQNMGNFTYATIDKEQIDQIVSNGYYIPGETSFESFDFPRDKELPAETAKFIKQFLRSQDRFYRNYDVGTLVEIYASRKALVNKAQNAIEQWARKFKIFTQFRAFYKEADIVVSMPDLTAIYFPHHEVDIYGEPKDASNQEYKNALVQEVKRQIADKHQAQLSKMFDNN